MDYKNIKVVPNNYNQLPKFKFLIYHSTDKNNVGCETTLVSAINENEAIKLVRYLKPNKVVGKVKQVNY